MKRYLIITVFFVAGFAAGLLTDALRPKESPLSGLTSSIDLHRILSRFTLGMRIEWNW